MHYQQHSPEGLLPQRQQNLQQNSYQHSHQTPHQASHSNSYQHSHPNPHQGLHQTVHQNSQCSNSHHNDFHYTDGLFSHDIQGNDFFKVIEHNLPAVFTRRTASEAIGGLISPKTFSNLDALGQGPPVKMKLGGKVGYEKESFVEWLKGRVQNG